MQHVDPHDQPRPKHIDIFQNTGGAMVVAFLVLVVIVATAMYYQFTTSPGY